MNFLAKFLIRAKFAFTSKEKAEKQTLQILEKYLLLSDSINDELKNVPVKVPKLIGVDEEMRTWSFNMLLEHNTIVNNSISAMVHQLYQDQDPHGLATIDPKKDVFPSNNPPDDQIKIFEDSVNKHVYLVSELESLRGTKEYEHPLFGSLDAHMWNCMFSYHMKLHYKQAKHIINSVINKKGLV